MISERIYVLDTNVLLHDPESIFSFNCATLGIPILVLEELDRFKEENTDRGYNARQVIRYLDSLRSKGSLRDGVPLDNGGIFRVLFVPEKTISLPAELSLNIVDNMILYTVAQLQSRGCEVIFISKDLNARIKADVLGIATQDYLKEHTSPKNFYKGWVHVAVPSISLKKEFPGELEEIPEHYDLVVNEFIVLESQNNPFNYKLFRYLGGSQFKKVEAPYLQWPLEARNIEQVMALDLLFDPQIQLVNLLGPAGTGKTFLALLAGLYQVLTLDDFSKMLVSRPVVPLGADIGYLPGTIEEKLHSWMQPIYDNMDFIVHAVSTGTMEQQSYEGAMVYADKGGSRHKKQKRHDRSQRKLESLDVLIKEGKISLEAITYMRGRSIPYQYILIDEAQNLTPHEVKTLISRVGEGSKIILVGDPYQIDLPYLDFSSNGLVVASNKFKGQSLFGTVFLHHSERSQLSKMVSEIWLNERR